MYHFDTYNVFLAFAPNIPPMTYDWFCAAGSRIYFQILQEIVTDLVLFEVTQGFDDDRPAALLLWVTRLQTHDVLGLADQRLHLPLTLHDPLFLSLHTHTGTIITH